MKAADLLHFPGITLLVTHYNRSASLERELLAFEDLHLRFGDIVVSDDGSTKEHLDALEVLRRRFGFRLITTESNRGLGHNINKGQDAVLTPFTLYVQEDFVPKPAFREALSTAMELLNGRPDIDVARFYAYEKYPYLSPIAGRFATMNFRFLSKGYKKYYYYSDHPHLRRQNFFQRFGRYREGIKGDQTEYNMMMSFVANKGKAIFFEDHQSLFDQVNTQDEPSTMKRNFLRNSDHLLIAGVRHLYRHIKFNFDYLRYKIKAAES